MLRFSTPQAWLDTVMADLDQFLLDHASCERKASTMAMSLVAHYPDRPELVRAMIALAQEELEHFRQVWVRVNERGLTLGPDTKDKYVRKLRTILRSETQEYFLDRLLVCGVIEARGRERFGMVADALSPDSPLKAFYENITRSEAKHQDLFLELAEKYFDKGLVDQRLDEILDFEAKIVAELPLRVALH
jgi:tRNA 2-(methylsulfanyl)-N6-isopentenyladenosine37 hydroxylase